MKPIVDRIGLDANKACAEYISSKADECRARLEGNP